ncbi:hypothetical protein AGDE_10810 [Angomonas deanei]|nr:hypothetical protein AGDE_10810 [Angomonas deanei]|eukprot:EPY27349.1 hypothetical protein AGDE_10810 [Angomonas deanei]
MNRHHKFYAELEAALEDDEYDDYYDEDEEEYYEEEQGEYDEAEDGAAAPQEAAPVVRRTSIHPDTDPDYDLLNDLLTVLDKRWSTEHPLEIPFPEEERVSALRGSNYDADGACATLYRDRLESKKNKGPKVLKVVGTGKNDKRKDDPSEEGGMEEEDTSASGTGVSSSVTLSKGKNSNKYRKSVELLKPDPTKPDCTFIIAGHVDAGKSTTLGHLLLLLGKVDVREVEKNAKDSKGTHKESFKYAWLLDQSEEERRRGVTIDSGSYCFETPIAVFMCSTPLATRTMCCP